MTDEPARDAAEIKRFIERFAQDLVDAGLPRIAARIFMAIHATDAGRLTAGELAEVLKASPAAISGGVRYLAQVNMLRRERDPGSRRDHYAIDDDVWYRAIAARDQLLVQWSNNLREGASLLGERTPAGRRFNESAEFFEFMQKELASLVDRWNEHKARRG